MIQRLRMCEAWRRLFLMLTNSSRRLFDVCYRLLRTEIYILLNGILLSSLYHECHCEIILSCGRFYLFNVTCDPALVPVWSMAGEGPGIHSFTF